jgi:hypothetical protein
MSYKGKRRRFASGEPPPLSLLKKMYCHSEWIRRQAEK